MTTIDRLGGALARIDDVRDLFARHGEPELFAWAAEQLGYITQRARSQAAAPPSIHLVRGDVAIDELAPASPWVLVVDGSLRASGDLDFATEPHETSLLVVMGDVSARHFRFNSGAACYIKRRLILDGECYGDHGDENAQLYCEELRARALILDHVTGVNTPTIEAVVCASEGWGLPMHVDYGRESTHAEVFVPAVLSNGLDLERAWQHAHAGGDIFLPGVYERLRGRSVKGDPGGKPR